MCNAHNHPPGCKCGWGGEGHLGKGGGGHSGYPFNFIVTVTKPSVNTNNFVFQKEWYQSYTNPNATSPVCGQGVYFYKSPTGGRVYFDELGPPWPKHPCTDSRLNGNKEAIAENLIKKNQSIPKWWAEGWSPVYLIEVGDDKSQYYVRIRILSNSYPQEEMALYIKGRFSDLVREPGILVYYRRIDDKQYELAFYDVYNDVSDSIIQNY